MKTTRTDIRKTLSRFISNLGESDSAATQSSGNVTQNVFEDSKPNIIKTEPTNQMVQVMTKKIDIRKTLSRFISSLAEPDSVTTESSGYITQNSSTEEEDENQAKSLNNSKRQSKIEAETPESKTSELQKITELNIQLSQKYLEELLENNMKPYGIEAEPSNFKTKELHEITDLNNKLRKKTNKNMESNKKRTIKNSLGKSNENRVNQNKLPTNQSSFLDREILKQVNDRPDSAVSELEYLTDLNIRLSQTFFKELIEEEKSNMSQSNKIKNYSSKSGSDTKKRKPNHDLQKKFTKTHKRLCKQADSDISENLQATDKSQSAKEIVPKSKPPQMIHTSKNAKKIVHKPKPPKMVHTSKKLSQNYRSEAFIEHIMELQKMRDVGIYVFCDSCDKIRYLSDTKDPLDLPDKWHCYMNPDKRFNSCYAPNYEVPAEDEEKLIKNKFNAGSIVWAKLEGYPWWPAMVDDDPDIEDYYWLDDPQDDEPTWYHVTFFDTQKVSRAWIKTKYLAQFEKNSRNRNFLPKTGDIFKHRIESSMRQALEACKMELLPRLRKYSFITRYFKPKKGSGSEKKSKKIPNLVHNVKHFENQLESMKPKKT